MSAERHTRAAYFLADRNELRGSVGSSADPGATATGTRPATGTERAREFRFSQLVQRGAPPNSEALLRTLAERMTAAKPAERVDGDVPAGFTYLGQFVDHDLTRDVTRTTLGTPVTVAQLEQGRSPALDLDSLYGRGPDDPSSAAFYHSDGVRLRLGRTQEAGPPPVATLALDGFDLPRLGTAATTPEEARNAAIPDRRNDENLSVAQIHLAFMRFHNAVVSKLASEAVPSALLFARARAEVVKHYQWMLANDFLPRIVDPAIVLDVFRHGRKVFETAGGSTTPTMPIEFSVAAYRLGHSMIREEYDWNTFFNPRPARPTIGTGALENLFRFSGTSGNLSPGTDVDNPLEGTFDRLPTNWIADWTRLFDFKADAGRLDLAPTEGARLNHARRIDTHLTDPLARLPLGSFAGRGLGDPADPMQRNLAFRNLMRGRMVGLATAQEVIRHFTNLGAAKAVVTGDDLLTGPKGVNLGDLPKAQRDELVTETPLWFYVLREAERSNGRMGAIGGRIVAEVFHRAIEASRTSILREPGWRPKEGLHKAGFGMVDVLLRAYNAGAGELRPLFVPGEGGVGGTPRAAPRAPARRPEPVAGPST